MVRQCCIEGWRCGQGIMSYNLTKKQWYDFWRRLRKNGSSLCFRDTEDWLQVRAKLHKLIREKTVDGKVSVNWSGMDCDCATYGSGSIEWAIPSKIERQMDVIAYDAEGPMSVWVDYPARIHTQLSRDLALEAFEDGHPHVVHW